MQRDPQAQVNSKSGNVVCDNIRIREDMILSGAIRGRTETETIQFDNNVEMKKDLTVDGDTFIKGNLWVDGGINENVAGTFDIIICGVGTAGAVAFRRISDGDPNLSVLGLVTGKNINDDPVSKYPFAVSDPDFGQINLFQSVTGATTSHTDCILNFNWLNYAINRNTVNMFAGRGQGGAGMHNFLFYVRPSPGFCTFASTYAGAYAASWTAAATNTIFQDMETYIGAPAQPNRGYAGPVQCLQFAVTANPVYGDAVGDILDSIASQSLAANDNALTITVDYNGQQELSLVKSQQQFLYPDADSPIGISRSSSSQGYMGSDFITEQGFSAVGRNNRMVYEAYVRRVLFDENNDAVGVEVIVNGQCKVYRANKKVIICAGAMRSPGILERSGIGSGARLSALGITQVAENPNVGENFQSHPAPAFIVTVDPDAYSNATFNAILQGYTTTPFAYDRQFYIGFSFPNGQGYLQVGNSYGSNFNWLQQLGIPLDGSNMYFGFIQLWQSTSRGSVHITNTSVDSQPKWIWNLGTDEDVFAARTGLQQMKRVEADLTLNHPTMGFDLKFPSPAQYAGYPGAPTIAFTASIAGTTMTVTAISAGTIEPTMGVLEGAGWSTAPASLVAQNTQIVGQIFPLLGGEAVGGIGRYTVTKSQTVGSMAMHGDYLEQAAAAINIIQSHPTGTCRMGDLLTQQGVVDGQLHVYGVQKLMVADNSIWAQIPNSNTTLAAQLVGYLAADFCLATI